MPLFAIVMLMLRASRCHARYLMLLLIFLLPPCCHVADVISFIPFVYAANAAMSLSHSRRCRHFRHFAHVIDACRRRFFAMSFTPMLMITLPALILMLDASIDNNNVTRHAYTEKKVVTDGNGYSEQYT